MGRLFVVAAVGAAFLLLAAPAFAGLAQQATRTKPTPALHVPPKSTQSSQSFASLGARLSGSITVTGTVYDSAHSVMSNIDMAWWSWSESTNQWSHGAMASRIDGTYSASPGATGGGEMWAYPDEDTFFGRLGQTWTAGNSYPGVDIYPGRVNVSATRDGPWHDFNSITLHLGMPADDAYSSDYQATSDTTTSPATTQSEALDGVYTGGSVNFWLDEGVEFSQALTVTSGTTPSGTINVSEVDAQRVQFSGYKYSGKPGATVRVSRVNFPAGWHNSVTGSSDPNGTAYKEYGTKVSQGPPSEALSVKVPITAKPGYSYWIGFQHMDASSQFLQPLYVETSYQVCTMKPSKTSITKSTRIRVSGVVPTEGHWGSQVGNRKQIVLWWHKGTASVPTKWDPRTQGWLAVRSLKTSGTGSYTTPSFTVPRTGTLVVQYDSDNWYFGGFTSTAKVTVR